MQISYVDIHSDQMRWELGVCLIDDSARYYLRCASTREEAVSTFLPLPPSLKQQKFAGTVDIGNGGSGGIQTREDFQPPESNID